MKRIFFLLGISLIIGFFNSVYSQQLVTWGNLANATVTNNVLVKTSEGDGWNAGAESKNMLAFGQDGWVEFELQEVTKKKAIGLTYEQSSGVAMDSIKCGFIFDFSGTTRVLYTRKLGTNTNIGTYDLNDVFRIEKVGTKVLFLKNGSKIDSCTLSSNTNSFFVDASIYTSGGQFHQVMTSLSVLDSLNVNPDKDAVVISSNSSINYGTHAYFWAYKGTNKATFTYRSLMEFSVSSIPPNAKIASAKLYLYGVDGDSPTQWGHRCETNCVSNSSKLYLNTALWTETTVTWDNKPNYTTSVFATLPASPSSVYDYSDYTVDIKDLVKNWVDGSYTNNGFTFMLNNESYYYTALQFRSSDHTNSSEHPAVKIKYYIGTKYYVNDNSLTGDVFCKATGDASNSGLSPYSPKASVFSILSTYVLGAKDTIFVDAGNYSEYIYLTSADCGSSSGQLVIHGAGKDLTTISSPGNYHNLSLTNADYVTVENLKLSNSHTSYFNVYNNGSQNMELKNDSLIHSVYTNVVIAFSSTSAYGLPSNSKIQDCAIISKYAGMNNIVVNGSGSYLEFSGNYIRNDYPSSRGLVINYAYSSPNYYSPSHISMTDNTILCDSIGIHINGVSAAKIDYVTIRENNIIIASQDSLTSCILANYSGTSSETIDTIAGNRLAGGRYGLYYNYTIYTRAFNNFFTNNQYGVKLISSNDNRLSFNSFYNDRTNVWTTTENAVSGMTLSNNIFYSKGSSSYQNLNIYNGAFSDVDYNCFYGPNGAKVARHNSTDYDSLAAWQSLDHYSGTGNGDENSIASDPLYPETITTDLDIDLFSPCTQAGSTISGISADINGRVRRSLPSIGAMEPELQVYIVTSLLDSVPGGVDSVVVDISGSGIDTSIFIKEDISLFPEIPTEGNPRLFIEFRTDTSAFDTTIYIVSLDAQGKIDSMLTVIDGEEIVLDSSYYTIYSERVLVLQNPVAGILFPNPVEIETSLEGGFILSPDQDGLYDTLRVNCSDYDTYSVVIYNEYGELVDSFEVSPATPNAYWDGKDSSNEYVNPGSYYFELIIEEVGYKYPFCVKY
ncbi:MAG: hypothetical protein CVU11_08525 [Bacteroidetes bacterium HGW-Bacteroidetes-6]|jgi:hypothetical protein|nr:MAG: hypothetical protein CVU11_08525 [Bacteroidetes bacterium HGW-Bacteroidetes-6]